MPFRRFMAAYWAWLAALAVVFVAFRPLQVSAIGLAGLTGSGAVLYGVRQHGPPRRWPWYCLAAALVLSAAGQIISRLLPGPVGTYRPGSLTHYGVLAVMSGLMVAGILGLARSAPRDLSAVVDVTILLLGTGLLVGVLVAVPYALTPDLPVAQAAARVFFVARDVIVLATIVHFATSERWNGSTGLLVGGTAGFLLYDALFRLGLLNGIVLQGTATELGWFFFAAAWGGAALLPAMRGLGEPGAPSRRSIPLRLGLLTGASVLPVGLLILSTYQEPSPWYEPLVASVSAIMLALVLGQLVDVAVRLRNQVAGEQALSRAVAEVAAASDGQSVAAALEAGVPQLGTGRATGSLLAAADYRSDGHGAVPAGKPAGSMFAMQRPPDSVERRLGPGPVLACSLCSDKASGELALYLRGHRRALDQLWPRLVVLTTQACLVLERIRLRGELLRRTTEEYVNAVASATGDVILLVDDDDRITLASRSAGSIFGTPDVTGARLTDLIDEPERGPLADLLRRGRLHETPADECRAAGPRPDESADPVPPPAEVTVGPRTGVDTASWTVRRGDGAQADFEAACRPITSTDPSVRGLLVDLRDVTQQRRLERDLAERATRDGLTGLASGLLVRERVRQGIETRPESLIGLIVVDLNDFKLINNQYGQDVGDAVLRTVGGRLAEAVAPDGLVGRVSGDRFAATVNVATPQDADEIARHLLAVVRRPITLEQAVITCTASAGIATTADADTSQELTRQADLALLTAREEGRGRWHHYDPAARSIVMERLEIRTALEHALDEQALALVYQPVVDLETGAVAGFEALLRWKHPVYRDLPPATFIDVAEESKLIIPIGEWALATAVRDARRWEAVTADPPPYVAVNVTSAQFASPNFHSLVQDQLATSGLAASRLHLEITESTLLSDEAVRRDLQRLRGLGVKIAIDDFGTGYSALSYLGRVPVDRVKLDRQFVASMAVSRTQRDLVEGIVKLTQILHLDVIAEGVETARERDLAAEVGCRFGQGYLFARPMPAEATLEWLAGERGRIRELALAGRHSDQDG